MDLYFPKSRSPPLTQLLVCLTLPVSGIQLRMVNFHDPTVVAIDNLATSKLWHVVNGLFLWEFFTTLDYEWSFIQGRRRYRWTIWIYSFSRMAALADVITRFVLLDTQVGCKLSEILALFPTYLAQAAASFLIVIRIVAIWNRNVIVIVIAIIMWAINGVFFIQGFSQLRYKRVFPGGYCTALNIGNAKTTVVASFITDIILLVIMLVGLFRLESHRKGAMATGRFLWNQGVIWLFLATFAGIVPTVFICLNLNEPLSTIFRYPWIITMTIASTRMYRGLDNFLSSDIHFSVHVPTGPTPTMPISFEGIRVDTHTAHSHSLTSQEIPHSLDSNMDGQPQEKPREIV
ncbi:hypothetical protein BJV77DRAFT_730005 [Russula vinacea]|nr:hypothetical protein BJV77DRAFT_730005 [Russula vinacea]